MRIIRSTLTVLAFVVVVLGAYLLAIDPRLLALVKEDLSALVPITKSSEEGNKAPTTSPNPNNQRSKGPPTVTPGGFAIASGCAQWTAEGLNLYYDPVDPSSICVQPPGSPVQAGAEFTSGVTQLPANCAVGPDSVVYCLVGGELSADTLQAFYNRGELQTPHETKGGTA